jgi:DNA-directed RNA polymerase subunit M/transcription elongation factor TFIIS
MSNADRLKPEAHKAEDILATHFAKPANIAYICNALSAPHQHMCRNLYEFMTLIQIEGVNSALTKLSSTNLVWSSKKFADQKRDLIEENTFMVSPYEISEGILSCSKCGCQKIFSFLKQTRSLDEPITTFALCSMCSHKWTE